MCLSIDPTVQLREDREPDIIGPDGEMMVAIVCVNSAVDKTIGRAEKVAIDQVLVRKRGLEKILVVPAFPFHLQAAIVEVLATFGKLCFCHVRGIGPMCSSFDTNRHRCEVRDTVEDEWSIQCRVL